MGSRSDLRAFMNARSVSLFNNQDAQEFADKLGAEIDAPYVSVRVSSLGNESTIFVRISMQAESEWSNRIYHSSPGCILGLYQDGVIESTYISGLYKRFRKTSVKSWEQAIEKINTYIESEQAISKKSER